MRALLSNTYAQLAWSMAKTGVLGFGGGPSVIPLLRHEAVVRCRWMDDAEFGEILAIANTLPGPILTKMSAYLGYRLKGTAGAVTAVCAHIFPSALAMLLLMSAVHMFSSSPVVAGMVSAVIPVITVMLGLMTYEFAEHAVKGLGKWVGGALFLVSFLLLETLHLHPGFVVALFLLYGAVHFRVLENVRRLRRRAAETGERGR